MNDLVIVYLIWFPVMVALAIAWFRELNAFQVDRPERPVRRRALAVAYILTAWVPFLYVVVFH